MATDFKLCPADAKTYGAGDWVTFDRRKLDDLPYDEYHALEAQLPGGSIFLLLSDEFPRRTGLGIKGLVWLSRKLSGIETVAFAGFNIKPMKVRLRPTPVEGGDVDPPAGGSSPAHSEDEAPATD